MCGSPGTVTSCRSRTRISTSTNHDATRPSALALRLNGLVVGVRPSARLRMTAAGEVWETGAQLRDGQLSLQLAVLERGEEGIDHTRVEVGGPPFDDDVFGLEGGHGLAIRAVAGQRIVDVGDRDDARLDRNLVPSRDVISGSVEFVMVREHNRDDPAQRAPDGLEHCYASPHLLLDLFVLVARQSRRLVQDLPADFELADVVQQTGRAHIL